MNAELKMGSLFDGSGGFPLAGSLCDIKPVWASEVEPYPIAVTTSRLPDMKHLGSVTDVRGSEIEPVDVITFGSPCQDLSIAGKRAGLKHEDNGDEETTRSGLFMEAIRIIKEMRDATNGQYPRIALWENVPGAFSSNKGEDFQTVLTELIRIVESETPTVPAPDKNGWPYADIIMGDGWSLAYRVFDAQHWGVPQRRRRIHLVLHLTGGCAGKILFERQGLRGHFAEGRTPWKAAPGDVAGGVGTAEKSINPHSFQPVYCLQGNGIDRADTAGCNGKGWTDGACYTLNTIDRPAVCYAETYQKCTGPLMANSHPGSYCGQDAYTDMLIVGKSQSEDIRYIVRRLTPTECARLQGFPDAWGHPGRKDDFTDDEYRFWLTVRNTHAAINGKAVKEYTKAQMVKWYNGLHTDSSEYKMWGNGIALPTALYVMQGIADALKGVMPMI